jgi:predicted outer membrane repeat protein
MPLDLKSIFCRGLGFLTLCAATVPARATTFSVTTTADSGLGSLRRAINEANKTPDSDRILFALPESQKQNGVWVIQPLSALPEITAPVRLTGPGSQYLKLKGAGLAVSQPVTSSSPDSSPQFVISGLTIRDGNGISSLATRLRLDDIRFINNHGSSRGGGLSSALTDLAVNNCYFEGNEAVTGSGLAVWAGGKAVVTNSTFLNNGYEAAQDVLCVGGAISCGGVIAVDNCRFSGNRADMGTAFFVEAYDLLQSGTAVPGEASLTNCVFQGNVQLGTQNVLYNWGGTVCSEYSNLTVQLSTFQNNSIGRGGAIYATGNDSFGAVKVARCTITGNSSLAGGAVFNQGGAVSLINSTISGNVTAGGGAIQNADLNGNGLSPSTTLTNCTLNRNGKASAASEIYADAGDIALLNTIVRPVDGGVSLTQAGGTITSLGHNLASDNGGGLLTATGDKVNVLPKFDLNGLQDNGGPTLTIALRPGSPAIDAGDDSVLGLPYNLGTDQRLGFPRKSGSHADIGAFEYQQVASPQATSGSSATLF